MNRLIRFRVIIAIALCACVYTCSMDASVDKWSALYRKQISIFEAEQYRNKESFSFTKCGVMPFSQLIFSWNAFRPAQGYFSFWVAVRDAGSRQWHPWQKMSEWGAQVQKSYVHTTKNGASYYHVRLEMPNKKKADAFRIKVKAHAGADLSLVRALYASLADFGRFKSEIGDKDLAHLSSVDVKGIARYSQMTIDHERSDSMCSPTSCSMLVNYLCKHEVDPRSFALKAHDTGLDAYGSWPFNTAHAFEQCNGSVQFRVERLRSFVSLHQLLSKNVPVVVSIRGILNGGFKDYNNGHLLVVIGWDARNKKVICHDPAFTHKKDILKHYDLNDFLLAWERSRRLAYVAQP